MDGQFQARIELPDGSDAWDDWFSWQEEGVDWRRHTASRTKGKRRKGAKGTASKAAPPAELERAALQQAVLRLASVRPAEASAAYASLRAEERLALLLALMRAACDTQEPPLT